MNSNDFNRFTYNPVDLDMSRSMLNLDHGVKFSANVGELIPFEVREVLPGDTFTVDTTKIIRMQPMVSPIMDQIVLDTYWFFVPNRLVWSHWQNFMGQNDSSAWSPSVEYTIPTLQIPSGGFDVGTIADYLGIPPTSLNQGRYVNVLPFRAYALICDQWFRAESLQDPVHVHVDDSIRTGVNTDDQVTDIELGGKPFIAGKFPDYFTSCLPAPQLGDPVTFSLAGDVPVNSLSTPHLQMGASIPPNAAPLTFNYGNVNNKFDYSSASRPVVVAAGSSDHKSNDLQLAGTNSTTATGSLYPANLYASLSQVPMFNINDLRTAFAIQRYMEKSARFGTRYIEMLHAFFGVTSPDARLQRAEYLGGSRVPLEVNSVQQTSATISGSTPQGNPSGLSVTGERHSDFTYSATEHGFIFGLAVARYHHTYGQGVERFWLYNDKFDFYLPTFANIGEQPVYGEELYFASSPNPTNPLDKSIFGYQEAWSHYKYANSRVMGEMRPGVSNSLSSWHLADYYSSNPTLNAAWIREDKTNVDRTLAVTSSVSNQYWCDFWIDMKAARVMPLYSIPGLIDHH